jgi:threonine dehydrogenase-like Zn-dependent dehydrogenase
VIALTIDMLARGRIDPSPMLSETVGWDAFPPAFEALRTDKSRVKVMLEPR